MIFLTTTPDKNVLDAPDQEASFQLVNTHINCQIYSQNMEPTFIYMQTNIEYYSKCTKVYALVCQRWEFIKENKKVRKQQLGQESDQDNKKKKKENKNSTKKKKEKNFLFFLDHFLGRVILFFFFLLSCFLL